MTRKMDLRTRFAMIIGAMLLWLVPAMSAQAATVNFHCITAPYSSTDCSVGEAQLTVLVSDPGINLITGAPRALFHFKNLTGGSTSSITDVYFDDGTLLDLSSITNGTGVSFSELASPANLPGGNSITPAFQTTKGFSADSNAPVQPSGVNPGEWVKVYFDLKPGGTFNDVISELGDGRLRIGVHIQGFSDSGSASFVNNALVVPVPAAVWLFGTGLLGLVGAARCRKN